MADKKQLVKASTEAIFSNPFDTQFSSFVPDTMEDKAKLFNAINTPNARLSDMINRTVRIRDVVLVKVTLTDDNEPGDDGEPNKRGGVRTIIIDDEGTTYSATSNGIFNSIQLIKNVFGTLHFDEPLAVNIKQVNAKRGSTLTLEVAI